jgi:hypothetical protein
MLIISTNTDVPLVRTDRDDDFDFQSGISQENIIIKLVEVEARQC